MSMKTTFPASISDAVKRRPCSANIRAIIRLRSLFTESSAAPVHGDRCAARNPRQQELDHA